MLALLGCSIGCAGAPRPAFRPVPSGNVATPGIEILAEDGTFRLYTGQMFTPPFTLGDRCVLDPTADNAGVGLANGAKPVIVKLADGRQLYGLLALCGAPSSATGPATRSYEIQVPEEYIAATAGGMVSVVFEPFTQSTLGAKAWILWLSQTTLSREVSHGNGTTSAARIENAMAAGDGAKTAGKWCAIGGLAGIGLGALLIGSVGIPGIPFAVLGATSLLIVAPIFYFAGVKEHNRASTTLSHHDGVPPDRITGVGVAVRF
jgi:hypothetical protein